MGLRVVVVGLRGLGFWGLGFRGLGLLCFRVLGLALGAQGFVGFGDWGSRA